MLRLRSTNYKIDTVFVAALFVLFAITSCLLVLLGAKQYQLTTQVISDSMEYRTAATYLTDKIQQNDTSMGITVSTFAGEDALALTDRMQQVTTYIYYYDGAIRELVVPDDTLCPPSYGRSVVTCKSFEPELVHSGLICGFMTDSAGGHHKIYLSIHASSGRDDL